MLYFVWSTQLILPLCEKYSSIGIIWLKAKDLFVGRFYKNLSRVCQGNSIRETLFNLLYRLVSPLAKIKAQEMGPNGKKWQERCKD